MVTTCLHTKIHKPSSNGSLVIAIKSKPKYRLHAASMLLLINLKLQHYTSLQYPKLSGISVDSTSQIHASTMLLLLTAGN
jgi:hypothetical protein